MAEAKSEAIGESKEREVLPKDVVPTLYTLSLTPDLLEHFRFFGKVSIQLDIKKETDSIILNALDLTFLRVSLKLPSPESDGTEWLEQSIELSSLKWRKKKQQVRIPLSEPLKPKMKKVILVIEYVGTLNDNMKGFYRSKYLRPSSAADAAGASAGKRGAASTTEAYCGVTQFEAADARRAFPCWDEPAAKAQYIVSLTVPEDLECLSNMPAETTVKHGSSLKTVTFQKTPVMSTYLLAWFVGEFACVEGKSKKGGTTVRVWAQRGKEKDGQFALDCCCRCLDFYEEYFKIDYILPKYDMIAVPDFAAGAMENYGCTIFREVCLLADESNSSLRHLKYVALVVNHELAHQWFGNYVTMSWWAELWLNEGFASWMEVFSTDHLFPDWSMWNQFITCDFAIAFKLDSMVTSHPIEVPVSSPAEAEEVFDSISYCKGAAIIRMLEAWIGEDAFRQGLSNYLTHFKYSSATTDDLWSFLGSASKKPVKTVMNNWTSEQGFPMVTVEYASDTKKLTVSQIRHLAGSKLTKAQSEVVWHIPLILRTQTGIHKFLFDEKKKVFDLNAEIIGDCGDGIIPWIHANADSNGFYLVEYSKELFDALIANKLMLSTIDKLCLIRDAAALAEACHSPYSTENLLNLIVGFKEDESYPVWDAIIAAAYSIEHVIDNDERVLKDFRMIMLDCLSVIWSKVGWSKSECTIGKKPDGSGDVSEEEHPDISSSLRPMLISSLVRYGNEDVIKQCLSKFHAFMKASPLERTPELLDPTLRQCVYGSAVREGDKKEFDLLKKYYISVDDPSEKNYALRALGNTRQAATISGLLAWILQSEQVKAQDKLFPFQTVAKTVEGRDLCWQFLQKNFEEFYQLFGGGFLVQHLVKIPSSFITLRMANEVEKFYATQDKPAAKRSMQQCLETIRTNAKWRTESIKAIAKWCADSVKSLSSSA